MKTLILITISLLTLNSQAIEPDQGTYLSAIEQNDSSLITGYREMSLIEVKSEARSLVKEYFAAESLEELKDIHRRAKIMQRNALPYKQQKIILDDLTSRLSRLITDMTIDKAYSDRP